MIVRIGATITMEAENARDAERLINSWIQGKEALEIIIDSIAEVYEDDIEEEIDEALYDFKGFDNYPGHPL